MFKIHKEPTNYFHLALIIIASITVAAFLYIAYLLTIITIEEVGVPQNFLVKRIATLSLAGNKPSYSVNDVVDVTVDLATRNRKTAGVGILLSYDPAFLEPVPQTEIKVVRQKNIESLKAIPEQYLNISASVFDTFPYMNIDYKKSLIHFSALKLPLQDFEGSGTIASLKFKTLQPGVTNLKFVFQKGSTTDTNVAFAGKDVLSSVTDLVINIR